VKSDLDAINRADALTMLAKLQAVFVDRPIYNQAVLVNSYEIMK